MKKGSILINTSRGNLVDEDALYKGILKGKIKGATLDVFKKEPPGLNNKLLSLPQVISTPHMGAATDDASNQMTKLSIEECLTVLQGKKPRYIVLEP